MIVSAAERRRADAMRARIAPLESLADRAVQALAGRLLRVLRVRGDLAENVRAVLSAHGPILAEAMLAADLHGRTSALRAIKQRRRELSLQAGTGGFTEEVRRAAVQNASLTASVVESLRQVYGREAEEIMARTGAQVAAGIQETMLEIQGQGLHVRAGKKLLAEKFEAMGISPRNPYALESIYRTELQKSLSAGQWRMNQSPEIDRILVSYKYVTAGDARVRPTHAGLDGTVLPKNHPRWNEIFPPNGYGCRCRAIEIFDDRAAQPPPDEFTTTVNGKSVTVRPGADPNFGLNFGKLIYP